MKTKILLIVLVLLNSSTLFGGLHASVLENDYSAANVLEIEHDHDHHHHHAHEESGHPADHTDLMDADHEHSHKHGIYVQLNCEIPTAFNVSVQIQRNTLLAEFMLPPINPTYSPPVPPPNL